MNSLQMKYFITTCKTLNITKAAETLLVSRTAISRIIKELEDEFRLPLFVRSKFGLSMTKEGSFLYKNCEKVYGMLTELENNMSSRRVNPEHVQEYTIKLGLSPLASSIVFPLLYKDVLEYAPNIHLEAIDCNRSESFTKLVNDEINYQITAGGRSEFPSSSIAIKDFCTLGLMLYVCPNHPLAGRDSVTLAEICDEPLVQLPQILSHESSVINIFKNEGLTPNIFLSTEQIQTIQKLVERGIASSVAAEGLLRGDIVKIPINSKGNYTLSLVWQYDHTNQPHMEAFLNYFEGFLQRHQKEFNL